MRFRWHAYFSIKLLQKLFVFMQLQINMNQTRPNGTALGLCISRVIAAGFRGLHCGLTIWYSSDRKFTLPSLDVTQSSVLGI